MPEPNLEQLRKEARMSAERLKVAEHAPLTDEQWAEAERATEMATKGCLRVLDAHGEVWKAYTRDLLELNTRNAELLAEARYWRQRALESEETTDA